MKNEYRAYISALRNLMIRKGEQGSSNTLLFWQQYVFTFMMIALNTMGFLVLFIGVRQFLQEGMFIVATVNMFIYFGFLFLSFARSIPYSLRHSIVSWAFYFLSILLLLSTGPRGMGQIYICTSLVLLLIHTDRLNGKRVLFVHIAVCMMMHFFYSSGFLDHLLISEYGDYWKMVFINLIVAGIFIILMVSMVMTGLTRRFHKTEEINARLKYAQEDNLRQIQMLNSLRQTGMCVMDTRLDMDERIRTALFGIRHKLGCPNIALYLAPFESSNSLCIYSFPEDMIGARLTIPTYSGPYILMDLEEYRLKGIRSNLGEKLRTGNFYFGVYLYTANARGYLEMILPEEPEDICLNYIQMSLYQLCGAITNDQLIQDIRKSRDILEASYDEILRAWARILELRDIETKGHCSRVVDICLNIADAAGLSDEDKVQLKRGAFLHDIGKLGIPDSILKKEGPLSDEEWKLMRSHPEIGRRSVENIPFLKPSVPVIYHHHERWDGNGYPSKLRGEEIPYIARIFSIADVYDALITDRPYRKAMEREEVVEYMRSEEGTAFDPGLMELFLRDVDAFTRKRSAPVEALFR